MSDPAAAERAIQRLVQTVALWIDTHRIEDLATLFTPDGSLQRANGSVLTGRDAIVRGMARSPGQVSIHHASPTRVELLGTDAARGTTSFVVYRPAADGGAAVTAVAAAYWIDRFTRHGQDWLIADRRTCALPNRPGSDLETVLPVSPPA